MSDERNIALLLEYFSLLKNADGWFNSRNEPYIVGFTLDGSEKGPSDFLGNAKVFPNVRKGDRITFGGEGLIVGQASAPKGFLCYSLLFMESDRDMRSAGVTIHNSVINTWRTSGAKEIFNNISPNAALVAGVSEAIIGGIATALRRNRDDELFRFSGTFFEDATPPFDAGSRYRNSNEYIECQIKVRSYKQGDSPLAGSIPPKSLVGLKPTDIK